MGYLEESLSTGEKVEHLFFLHWTAKIRLVLWIILAFPTFGITLGLAIYEWLRLRTIEMGVTNKRVVLKTGIISRTSKEMKLTSMETVEIEQGVLGRILGFGAVRITGCGISDLVLKHVDDPLEVKRKIESISPLQAKEPDQPQEQ